MWQRIEITAAVSEKVFSKKLMSADMSYGLIAIIITDLVSYFLLG